MNRIKKWLIANGIDFVEGKGITIYLSDEKYWINGFEESMPYRESFYIHQNTYKEYLVEETIGYNRGLTVKRSSQSKAIIEYLESRLLAEV